MCALFRCPRRFRSPPLKERLVNLVSEASCCSKGPAICSTSVWLRSVLNILSVCSCCRLGRRLSSFPTFSASAITSKLSRHESIALRSELLTGRLYR